MAIEYLDREDGRSGALNLGTGKGYSNQEIVNAVTRLIGAATVKIGPRRLGDPDRLVASSVQAASRLDWQPEHSDLDTIINSAWKWYNNPPQSIDI
jgi:UDP-glucose 4-epimerase